MVRWIRCHCPPDTEFQIRTLAVWGRARYFSITETPHTIESLRSGREERICFFETWMPERGSNPRHLTFQEGSFNQCTRAPPLPRTRIWWSEMTSQRTCSAAIRGSCYGIWATNYFGAKAHVRLLNILTSSTCKIHLVAFNLVLMP